MEGYASFKRLKDSYNPDLDIEIIYNSKFSSKEDHEKNRINFEIRKDSKYHC